MQEVLVPSHLQEMYWEIYPTFEDLPVTMTVFGDLKVSFKISFCNRTLLCSSDQDFGQAKFTICWLETQYEELSRLANYIKQTVEPVCFHLTSFEMADLEKIEDGISFSQLSFESGVYQIWDYLGGLVAEKQEQPREEADNMNINKKWEKRIHKLLYGKK